MGVLTGSEITDLRILLIAGKAHTKHTEGGDFRQATYRAIRQGLRSGKSILLEPWFSYRLEVPTENLGRAMSDITRMNGRFDPPVTEGNNSDTDGQCAGGNHAGLRQRSSFLYQRTRQTVLQPAGVRALP